MPRPSRRRGWRRRRCAAGRPRPRRWRRRRTRRRALPRRRLARRRRAAATSGALLRSPWPCAPTSTAHGPRRPVVADAALTPPVRRAECLPRRGRRARSARPARVHTLRPSSLLAPRRRRARQGRVPRQQRLRPLRHLLEFALAGCSPPSAALAPSCAPPVSAVCLRRHDLAAVVRVQKASCVAQAYKRAGRTTCATSTTVPRRFAGHCGHAGVQTHQPVQAHAHLPWA